MLRRIAKAAWSSATHTIGRMNGRYFFEDFVRVYPDGMCLDQFGRRR
jgi:sugar lactone lactonase YvrE